MRVPRSVWKWLLFAPWCAAFGACGGPDVTTTEAALGGRSDGGVCDSGVRGKPCPSRTTAPPQQTCAQAGFICRPVTRDKVSTCTAPLVLRPELSCGAQTLCCGTARPPGPPPGSKPPPPPAPPHSPPPPPGPPKPPPPH